MATNYVAPATKIYILKGIPFDNTFTHTIYFPNINAQTNYFTSRRKVFDDAPIPFDDTDCTYQRQDNLIKIAHNAEQIRDCNYLMYQNRGFGNKWFYAFITGVHHSNNTCTWVTFEIDPLQTFMFDINILPCMVEREHSVTDSPGSNIIPEPISIDEYTNLSNSLQFFDCKPDNVVCQMVSQGIPTGGKRPGTYAGSFQGSYYVIDNGTLGPPDFEQTETLLNELTVAGRQKELVSMFMAPHAFVVDRSTSEGNTVQAATFNQPAPGAIINGHAVRNNKLLTYPYYFIALTNNEGSINEYKFEHFTGGTSNIFFKATGSFNPNMEIICYPVNYEAITDNIQEGITLNNFPQCSYLSNTFTNYLMSQSLGNSIRQGGFVYKMLQPPAPKPPKKGKPPKIPVVSSANYTSAAIAIASELVEIPGKVYDAYQASIPELKGSALGASAIVAKNRKGYEFVIKVPRTDILEMIDDYFDMYGYATNKLKIPNLNSRPHWNYVKTSFANIIPKTETNTGISNEYLVAIRNIFDAGITFWKNPTEVGNYDLDNRVNATPPTNVFNITFYANGGTGTMPAGTAYAGIPYIMPQNSFIPPVGKQFKHWDVNGNESYPGGTVVFIADTTVAAIWEDLPGTSYIVSYNAGAGRMWANMPNETAEIGVPFVLPQNEYFVPPAPKAPDYITKVFDKWLIYDGEYRSPGETIDIIQDTNVTATWKTIQPALRKNYFLTVAENQLGKPYVSGGNGPKNFDCSGLIYYCLNMADYVITDATADWYSNYNRWSYIGSKSDLEAGDLVFFWNAGHTKAQHCGIYIGDDYMIHASTSNPKSVKKVKFSNYTALAFKCGRRVDWARTREGETE